MARTIRNRTAAWGLSTSIGVFIGSFLSSDLKRNATSQTTPRIRVHAGRNSSHRHFRLSGELARKAHSGTRSRTRSKMTSGSGAKAPV